MTTKELELKLAKDIARIRMYRDVIKFCASMQPTPNGPGTPGAPEDGMIIISPSPKFLWNNSATPNLSKYMLDAMHDLDAGLEKVIMNEIELIKKDITCINSINYIMSNSYIQGIINKLRIRNKIRELQTSTTEVIEEPEVETNDVDIAADSIEEDEDILSQVDSSIPASGKIRKLRNFTDADYKKAAHTHADELAKAYKIISKSIDQKKFTFMLNANLIEAHGCNQDQVTTEIKTYLVKELHSDPSITVNTIVYLFSTIDMNDAVSYTEKILYYNTWIYEYFEPIGIIICEIN